MANTLFCLAKVLLDTKYTPVTGYKMSLLSNSHTESEPHCGPNQGLMDRSPGCVLLSNTLMKVYDKGVPGVSFMCPEKKIKYQKTIEQFIDDTNTCHDADRNIILKKQQRKFRYG